MQTKHEQNTHKSMKCDLYAKGVKNMDASPLKQTTYEPRSKTK